MKSNIYDHKTMLHKKKDHKTIKVKTYITEKW